MMGNVGRTYIELFDHCYESGLHSHKTTTIYTRTYLLTTNDGELYNKPLCLGQKTAGIEGVERYKGTKLTQYIVDMLLMRCRPAALRKTARLILTEGHQYLKNHHD
jgi:hypothetical protein